LPDPVLHQVVKGSGKAADLLADVVIITDALTGEDKELNSKDEAQGELKQVLQDLVPAADDAANYDIFAAISALKTWEDDNIAETDIQRRIDIKLRRLLCVSYSIVQKGANNATTKHLYKYLRESLEAVSTGMVSVFDLKGSSADFNGALLKCLLKSIDTSSSAGNNSLDPEKAWNKLKYAKAWKKLEYIMRWGRDDLVREQLSEVLHEGFP